MAKPTTAAPKKTTANATKTKTASKRPGPVASPAKGSGAPPVDIGMSSGDRKDVADGLAHFLADAFTLYLKTHNFHWNVTGPMFNTLHVMFEAQYTSSGLRWMRSPSASGHWASMRRAPTPSSPSCLRSTKSPVWPTPPIGARWCAS